MTIDLRDDDTDLGSWLELWAGVVAVNEICVKKGKAGISFGNGKSPKDCVDAVTLVVEKFRVEWAADGLTGGMKVRYMIVDYCTREWIQLLRTSSY